MIIWTQIRSYSSKNINECFEVHILDPTQTVDEFLYTENANLDLKNFLFSRIAKFWRLPLSHISIVDNKVYAEHADLMVMTHLMTGKVMTGQEFIDLADPQEKMRRLNPHSRIGFMFPGFALGALLAVAAWVVYFGVSSLLFAFG